MNTKNLSQQQKLQKKPVFYQRMQTQYDYEKQNPNREQAGQAGQGAS